MIHEERCACGATLRLEARDALAMWANLTDWSQRHGGHGDKT